MASSNIISLPTAAVKASIVLTSCCIAIVASSWVAYRLGIRHGRTSEVRGVDDIDTDTTTGIVIHDNSAISFSHRPSSTMTPSPLPAPEGCSTAASPSPTSLQPAAAVVPLPTIYPIGTLHSIYRLCVGTPRQGMLVPHSRGIITFDETFISQDSIFELKQYSHVYVVFVFHLNSNTHKLLSSTNNDINHTDGALLSSSSTTTTTKSARQFPSKIAPPSLGGKKVGVFSTRTPHRPNPIGFSLCRLDKVLVSSSSSKQTQKIYNNKQQHGSGGRDCTTKTTFSLLLSGLDLVDGTPILDIKPYVPHYDCVGYGNKSTIIDGVVSNEKEREVEGGGSSIERRGKNTSSSCNGAVVEEFHDGDNSSNNDNSLVRVPQWVDSGLQKRRSISFLPAAEQFLIDLAKPPPPPALTSSSSSSSSSPEQPLLSKMQFYGPNSPWQDKSPSIAVQHVRNVIIEILTSDVRSVWQTAKARRGAFQAERSARLSSSSVVLSSTEKKAGGEGGGNTMYEGNNDQEMIENYCCCTQQIDNLLVHYTIDGPTIISSSTTTTTRTQTIITPDERSMGSGAEDTVVVVSISFII
jgi:tRNA (Thr-GGU) A37 N-methylase